MVAKNTEAAGMTSDAVSIVRELDAPRELVWKAWTEPERFMRWWGPKEFTSPLCEIDLRVGGKFLWCMQWPDGRRNFTIGEYREVVPIERLVYTTSFADADGKAVPASHYGMTDDVAFEMKVTVTLEERNGKTLMMVTHAGLPAGSVSENAAAGWNESFDKMEASLR